MRDKKSLSFFFYLIFLLSFFDSGVQAAVTAPYRGRLGTQIRYTPEHGFENGYFINLSSSLRKRDDNFEFGVNISNLDVREGQLNWYFPDHNRNANWRLGSFFIRNTSPLGNGLGASNIRIGDVSVRYSPYTVYLHGSTHNRSRRGIILEKFALGDFSTDGFLVWVNSLEKPLYGFKTSWTKSQFKINYIAAQQATRTPFVSSIDETVTSLEFNKDLQLGSFAFITAKQYINDKAYGIFQVTLSKNITSRERIQLVLQDFQPGYSPSFSDHTPKFDWVQKSKYNWNPVDRYANRKGVNIDFNSRGTRGSINLRKEYYLDRDFYRNKTYREALVDLNGLEYNLSFPALTGKISASHQRIQLENPFQDPNIESATLYANLLSKNYRIGSLFSNLNLLLWAEENLQLTDYLGNNKDVITEKGYLLEINFIPNSKKSSFFIGISGAEEEDGPNFYKSVGFNYKSPASGLNLVINLTTPNFNERRDPYSLHQYDRRFGFMNYPDNIIEITNIVEF